MEITVYIFGWLWIYNIFLTINSLDQNHQYTKFTMLCPISHAFFVYCQVSLDLSRVSPLADWIFITIADGR